MSSAILISGENYQSLNTLSGIPIGTEMKLQNTVMDNCYIIESDTQPASADKGHIIFNASFNTLSVATIRTGSKELWVKCINPDGYVTLVVNGHISVGGDTNDFQNRDDLVALGLVVNERRVALYGNNTVIDAGSVPEDIWPNGGAYPWMTAATSLEVVSSSASDTSDGVGARTLILNGLDINYNEISALITMNGITPVAIPTQFFRINSCSIVTAGASEVNVGTITIRDSGAGTTRAVMPIGIGNLRQCIYTVPAGYKFMIYSVLVGINRTDTSDRWASLESWVRVNGVISQPAEASVSSSSTFLDIFEPKAVLPEKSDTMLRVVNVSGPNTNITGAIRGKLVKLY